MLTRSCLAVDDTMDPVAVRYGHTLLHSQDWVRPTLSYTGSES